MEAIGKAKVGHMKYAGNSVLVKFCQQLVNVSSSGQKQLQTKTILSRTVYTLCVGACVSETQLSEYFLLLLSEQLLQQILQQSENMKEYKQ